MKLILRERVPRKFNLLWDEPRKSILIRVHENFVNSFKNIPDDLRLVEAIKRTHDCGGLFDSFSGDLLGNQFGFNGSLKKIGGRHHYIDFAVRLPKMKIKTTMVCETCDGTGENTDFDQKCLDCQETGVKHIHSVREAFCTTASLSIFFEESYLSAFTTDALDEQHVEISGLCYLYEMHGSSLAGVFGINFIDFLTSAPQHVLGKILGKIKYDMKYAWEYMNGHDSYSTHSIRASCDNGFIALDCPGDACGIHLSSHYRDPGCGRDFTCHNVDRPEQALTLLVGIASLVEQVDHQLSPYKKNLVCTS